MSVSEKTIDTVIHYIDKNKGTRSEKIASHLNLRENEVASIIQFLMEYKFIGNSHGYLVTKVGRDYLKIKS
jgi:predicted transcriptional regulator